MSYIEQPIIEAPTRVYLLGCGDTGDDFEVEGVISTEHGDLWAIRWDYETVIFVHPGDLAIGPTPDQRPIQRCYDITSIDYKMGLILNDLIQRAQQDFQRAMEQESLVYRLLKRD